MMGRFYELHIVVSLLIFYNDFKLVQLDDGINLEYKRDRMLKNDPAKIIS